MCPLTKTPSSANTQRVLHNCIVHVTLVSEFPRLKVLRVMQDF